MIEITSPSSSVAPASPQRLVQRVRHELRRRQLQVVRIETVSPHFRRVTLNGDALEGFTSLSFDDHVKVLLDSGSAAPIGRDYTPLHFDATKRELVIEFVLHGDGPAADWAAQAQPGQHLTIGGPRGSFIVPLDYDWHLLAGDETALPAITRRLAELPKGTRAIVRVQLADPADQRVFSTQAALELQWVASSEALLAAVRALQLPKGEGYAWCAGEAATTAELRRILVTDKGHDRHAIRAAAYWKRGTIAHHENLEDPQ
jgi:NADPH-dependent ferric siderophore reductase